MRNKNLKNYSILAILLLIGLIAYSFSGQFFAVVQPGEVVWLPEYSSNWCGPCNVGVQTFSDSLSAGFFADIRETYTCAKDEYAPNGCEITIGVSEDLVGETAAYVCPKNQQDSIVWDQLNDELGIGDGDQIENCRKYGDERFTEGLVTTIQMGDEDKLYLMTEESVSVNGLYQPFCMFQLSRGRLQEFDSCEQRIFDQQSLFTQNGETDIKRSTGRENAIDNVVIGYDGYKDMVDVVNHNGNAVLLQRTFRDIEVCPIERDENGVAFVNTVACYEDNSFICVPSSPPEGQICVEGKELVAVAQGETCSGSGLIGKRVVDGEKCQVYCNGGFQEVGRCERIIGQDQGGTEPLPVVSNPSYLPIYLLGVLVVILFAVTAILALRRKK